MTETPREQEQEKKEGRQRTQLQGQPVPSGPRRPPVNRAAHGPLSPLSASTSLSQALPAAGTAGANGLQRPLLPRRPQKSGRLSLRLCVPPELTCCCPDPQAPRCLPYVEVGPGKGPRSRNEAIRVGLHPRRPTSRSADCEASQLRGPVSLFRRTPVRPHRRQCRSRERAA